MNYGAYLRSPYVDYQSAQIDPDLRLIIVFNFWALQEYLAKKPQNS